MYEEDEYVMFYRVKPVRKKARNKKRRKKWIKKAIKRPGALRKKFAKWYGLKKGQKISMAMYKKGLARARRRKDKRTMRQIRLAMTLARMRKRKGKVIRGKFGRRKRRVAANRRKRRR